MYKSHSIISPKNISRHTYVNSAIKAAITSLRALPSFPETHGTKVEIYSVFPTTIKGALQVSFNNTFNQAKK